LDAPPPLPNPRYEPYPQRDKPLRYRLDQEVVDRQYKAAGILVNTDGKVPLDESSACYKSSEEVINAVVGAGLAEIEYRLWPLASLKGTEGARKRKK